MTYYVETHRAIDINQLLRCGALKPGIRIAVGGTSLTAADDHIIFEHGGRTERIWLTYTVPGYGGRRRWFHCPLCGSRRAKLHFMGRFACRVCGNLKHGSKSESRRVRLARKARKIRSKVGSSDSLGTQFPPKPPGMWWRTYDRLRAQEAEIERERIALFLPMLARLHERVTGKALSVVND